MWTTQQTSALPHHRTRGGPGPEGAPREAAWKQVYDPGSAFAFTGNEVPRTPLSEVHSQGSLAIWLLVKNKRGASWLFLSFLRAG